MGVIRDGTLLVACLSVSAGFPDFSNWRDGGLNFFTPETAYDYQKLSLQISRLSKPIRSMLLLQLANVAGSSGSFRSSVWHHIAAIQAVPVYRRTFAGPSRWWAYITE